MQKDKKKPKWGKPKLIVLVRGKPEERLLQACKGFVYYNDDPGTRATDCLHRYYDIQCIPGCENTFTS